MLGTGGVPAARGAVMLGWAGTSLQGGQGQREGWGRGGLRAWPGAATRRGVRPGGLETVRGQAWHAGELWAGGCGLMVDQQGHWLVQTVVREGAAVSRTAPGCVGAAGARPAGCSASRGLQGGRRVAAAGWHNGPNWGRRPAPPTCPTPCAVPSCCRRAHLGQTAGRGRAAWARRWSAPTRRQTRRSTPATRSVTPR